MWVGVWRECVVLVLLFDCLSTTTVYTGAHPVALRVARAIWWEWGVDGANFWFSCCERTLLQRVDDFGGPSGLGKGGVGETGGSCEWMARTFGSVAANGPFFNDWMILEVPLAWGREGWGGPVEAGRGCL